MAANNYWNQARNVTLATVRFGTERRTNEDQNQDQPFPGAWTPEGFNNGGNNGATAPTAYGVSAVANGNGWAPEPPPQPPRYPTFPGAYGSQCDDASTLSSLVGTDDAQGFDYSADNEFNNTEYRGFEHTEKKSRLSIFRKKQKAKTANDITATSQDPLHGKLLAQPTPVRMDSSPSSFSGQSSSQFNPLLQSRPSWSYTPTMTSNSTGQMPTPQSTSQNAQAYGTMPVFAQHFSADPVEDTTIHNYSQTGVGAHAYRAQNIHGMGVASPPPQYGPTGSGSVTDYSMPNCDHPKDRFGNCQYTWCQFYSP